MNQMAFNPDADRNRKPPVQNQAPGYLPEG